MQLAFHLLILFLVFESGGLYASAIECKTSSSPSKVSRTIVVSQNGARDFSTITGALNSIRFMNDDWIKVIIRPGIYQEQVRLAQKSCIILEGEDRSTTVITHDGHDNTLQSVTFDTWDVHNFFVKGITFRNSYNWPFQPSRGIVPAVALRASGDKHIYHLCGFQGYQDTLWDNVGRHFFSSSYIEGAVDFIWGDGQSVYQKCVMNATGNGYMTAQGRESPQSTTGYVLTRCQVLGTSPNLTFLGRPYRAFSRVVLINSILSNVVNPLGWFIWEQTGHENDITFAEISSVGPGAGGLRRVPWAKKLTGYEARIYTTRAFINRELWIETYLGGLEES